MMILNNSSNSKNSDHDERKHIMHSVFSIRIIISFQLGMIDLFDKSSNNRKSTNHLLNSLVSNSHGI